MNHRRRLILSLAGALPLVPACAHLSDDRAPRDAVAAEAEPDEVSEFHDWRLDAYETSEDVGDRHAPVIYSSSVEPFMEPSLEEACGRSQPELYFSSDASRVAIPAETKVEMLATCLSSHALEDAPISVVGHADPRTYADDRRVVVRQ